MNKTRVVYQKSNSLTRLFFKFMIINYADSARKPLRSAKYHQVFSVGKWPSYHHYLLFSISIQPRPVKVDDFLNILSHNTSTVAKEDLQRFEQFTINLGQRG